MAGTSAADRYIEDLGTELSAMPSACGASIAAVEERVADILRPPGALARLDAMALWLAGWQRSETPSVDRPAALIFAGDHGVTADGVSAYPADVTGAMLAAFRQDRASISAMARVAGASVTAVDVGVGDPTENIRTAPAMDNDRFMRCFEIGRVEVRTLIDDRDVDLLILGEMGIGNTTATAAVCSLLLARPAADLVGAGTGVGGKAFAKKIAVVDESVARARAAGVDPSHPLEALRHLGGTELVAIAGAMFEARSRSIAILLDGYITSSAALALHMMDPSLTANIRAGHGSAEPGHRLVLEALGLDPMIELDFRLGEASGAMAALPLVKMGCELVTAVPTFTEWFAAADAAPEPEDRAGLEPGQT